MGYAATYPSGNTRPKKNTSPRKSASGEFFAKPNKTRQGNRPTPTKTASGVFYYGYRYYDSNAGRWLSRDPIRERGGLNIYGFVGNDGIINIDLLGQVEVKGLYKTSEMATTAACNDHLQLTAKNSIEYGGLILCCPDEIGARVYYYTAVDGEKEAVYLNDVSASQSSKKGCRRHSVWHTHTWDTSGNKMAQDFSKLEQDCFSQADIDSASNNQKNPWDEPFTLVLCSPTGKIWLWIPRMSKDANSRPLPRKCLLPENPKAKK